MWNSSQHDLTLSVLSIAQYKSSVSLAWDSANDRVKDKMNKMLQTDEGPAGTFFRSCMDLERIEKEDGEPLKPWLAIIDGIEDQGSLVKAVVEFNKQNQDTVGAWRDVIEAALV